MARLETTPRHEAPGPRPFRARWARVIGLLAVLVVASLTAGVPQAAGDGQVPPWEGRSDRVGGLPTQNMRVEADTTTTLQPSRQELRIADAPMRIHAYRVDTSGRYELHAYLGAAGARLEDRRVDDVTFTMATLAFGMIPAKAKVVIRAPRLDGKLKRELECQDLPCVEPWLMRGPNVGLPGGHELVGRVEMQLTELVLDGERVASLGACRTRTPARVQLSGSGGYVPIMGGRVSGTIDIPEFTRCGPGGSLNGIVTAMTSKAGQPIEAEISVPKPVVTQ